MGSSSSSRRSTKELCKKVKQSKAYKREQKLYNVGYFHTLVDNNNNIIGIILRKRFGVCYWAGYVVDHMLTDLRLIDFNQLMVINNGEGHYIPNSSMEVLDRVTFNGMNFVGFEHCHSEDARRYTSLGIVEQEVLWLYNEIRRINGYTNEVRLRTSHIY